MTIDDLRALVELLGAQKDSSKKPVIEFSGGTIDNPEDIVALSDEELSEIVVKSEGVDVYLSADHAFCVGAPDLIHAVYSEWARLRPAKLRPRGVRSKSDVGQIRVGRVFMGFYSALAIAGFVLLLVRAIAEPSSGRWWLFAAANIAMLVVLVLSHQVFTRPSPNRAEIHALTLKEFREAKESKYRQLITWLIASLGVAVAAIGVLVAILVNK